jgi:hypothetical protein
LVVIEFYIQARYFLGLDPDVITSCCGSLFSSDAKGVAAEVSSLTPWQAVIALYGSGLLVMLMGTFYLWRKKGGLVFALSAVAAFISALAAIVSYISLYIYEHPHHHCPFCILKSGHDYAGYTLYIPLFLAVSMALAAGVISPWKNITSLKQVVAIDSHRITYASLILFVVFYAMSTYWILQSSLTMQSLWW